MALAPQQSFLPHLKIEKTHLLDKIVYAPPSHSKFNFCLYFQKNDTHDIVLLSDITKYLLQHLRQNHTSHIRWLISIIRREYFLNYLQKPRSRQETVTIEALSQPVLALANYNSSNKLYFDSMGYL